MVPTNPVVSSTIDKALLLLKSKRLSPFVFDSWRTVAHVQLLDMAGHLFWGLPCEIL